MALPDSRRPSMGVTKAVAKDFEDLDRCIISFLQKDNAYMEDLYLDKDRSDMKSFADYFEDYYQDILFFRREMGRVRFRENLEFFQQGTRKMIINPRLII